MPPVCIHIFYVHLFIFFFCFLFTLPPKKTTSTPLFFFFSFLFLFFPHHIFTTTITTIIPFNHQSNINMASEVSDISLLFCIFVKHYINDICNNKWWWWYCWQGWIIWSSVRIFLIAFISYQFSSALLSPPISSTNITTTAWNSMLPSFPRLPISTLHFHWWELRFQYVNASVIFTFSLFFFNWVLCFFFWLFFFLSNLLLSYYDRIQQYKNKYDLAS